VRSASVTSAIKKVVFPVAGLGTRFLPATKAVPKEMLPIVDRPLIQYAAEEAVAAGAEELIFVTRSGKQGIADHFDANYELENELAKSGKEELLRLAREVIPERVACVFVRQPQALGLGHAVLCARKVVGDHPFGVILPDDLIYGEPSPCLQQMGEQFAVDGNSLVAVEDVDPDDTDKYGIVDAPCSPDGKQVAEVQAIVEKPAPDVAPSTLGVVGRYILTPRIFDLLASTDAGSGGEIQLTDAISRLLTEQKVQAFRFGGIRYDCGTKLGYLKANVEYALRDRTLGSAFRDYLGQLVGQHGTH
jgi:UTP--glucose-1-phosphate uridylyltransferase